MIRTQGAARRHSIETHHVHVDSRREMVSALTDVGFSVGMGRSFGRVRLLRGDVAVIVTKERRKDRCYRFRIALV